MEVTVACCTRALGQGRSLSMLTDASCTCLDAYPLEYTLDRLLSVQSCATAVAAKLMRSTFMPVTSLK